MRDKNDQEANEGRQLRPRPEDLNYEESSASTVSEFSYYNVYVKNQDINLTHKNPSDTSPIISVLTTLSPELLQAHTDKAAYVEKDNNMNIDGLVEVSYGDNEIPSSSKQQMEEIPHWQGENSRITGENTMDIQVANVSSSSSEKTPMEGPKKSKKSNEDAQIKDKASLEKIELNQELISFIYSNNQQIIQCDNEEAGIMEEAQRKMDNIMKEAQQKVREIRVKKNLLILEADYKKTDTILRKQKIDIIAKLEIRERKLKRKADGKST